MTEPDRSEHLDNAMLPSKKKKGIEYDIDIDRAVLHELNLSESVSSSQLKIRIEKFLGRRSITPSVYYDHIKRMLNEKDLDMKDTGKRGQQSVFYSLTTDAKKEWRLDIHRVNHDHILFREIYERLFFYEFEEIPAFIVSSEGEFDKLLQLEFNTTREQLNWYRTADGKNHVIVEEVYQSYFNTSTGKKSKKSHKEDMEEYWKEKDGQSSILEEVVFCCAPVENNVDVWIVKTEYWEINRNGKHKKYDTDYRVELPGVAIKELMNNKFIGTRHFKEEDVEKALSLLIKEGLLEPCMIFRGETRYKIADQRLRYMIEVLRYFHFGEFNLLLYKWENFEKPTNKEIERINWLLGEQEAKRILRAAEMKRHRNKEIREKSKNLEEYHNRYLAESMVPMYMTAEYYNAHKNEMAVPHLNRSKLSINNDTRLYDEFDAYKEKRRNSVITQKEAKQDILEFHEYRRERLARSEQSLQWDAENLKMQNADVLKEYKFLHNTIKKICPLIFEPGNYELQKEIIEDDYSMESANRELARMMGAIYIGNAYKRKPKNPSKTIIYDYKRKKRVPYKTHIVENKITGRQEKIVDIGKYFDKDNDDDTYYLQVALDFLKYREETLLLNYRTFYRTNASGLIRANLISSWLINIF